MNLTETLKKIADTVQNDPNLTEELRADLLDLVAEVNVDPTPANLKVLTTALEKLQNAVKYISAMETLKNVEVESQAPTA